MIILIVCYILFTLKVNIKLIHKENSPNARFLNLYIRILTDYFQILSALTKIQAKYIDEIGNFFENFSFVSDILGNFFSFLYPLECIYNLFEISNTNAFYLNLYVLLSVYPIIIFANLIFWGGKLYKNKNSHPLIFKKLTCLLFLISYLLQPSFINAYFKYIICIKIDGFDYLKIYLKERCWVSSHFYHFIALILPSLIFWMVIYPLGVLILIYKNYKNLKKRNNHSIFSFFTDGLKPNFFYWEIWLMFKRYIFIILTIFPLVQSFLVNCWILCIFSFFVLFIQIKSNPYEFNLAFKISLFANAIILIGILGITVILIENTVYNQMILVVFFFLLNILLFFKWGYDIYNIKKYDIAETFTLLKSKFWGCCYKKYKTKDKSISPQFVIPSKSIKINN